MLERLYDILSVRIKIFLYFHFYVSSVAQSKGMVESSLLSKDESLTPNIFELMGV